MTNEDMEREIMECYAIIAQKNELIAGYRETCKSLQHTIKRYEEMTADFTKDTFRFEPGAAFEVN